MITKDFIKIINEEIKNFDFLNSEDLIKEQDLAALLTNEDLQKQFICDSLLRRKDKITISRIVDSYITGNWDESSIEDADRMTVLYSLDIEYLYDSQKEPLKFNLHFEGDDIDISVDGWKDAGQWGGTMADAIEPSGESWFDDFDWGNISVKVYTMDGDDVRFTAFDVAPPKIKTLFIREYVEKFVEIQTLEMRTIDKKDSIQDVPYC